MRRFIGGTLIGIVIGVIVATKASRNNNQYTIIDNKNYADSLRTKTNPIKIHLSHGYSGSIPFNGELGTQIVERLNKVNNGIIVAKHEKLSPKIHNLTLFEAVSSGVVDASLSTSQSWSSQSPAFGLFSSVPFGPGIVAYLTWFRHHGGQAFYEKLYFRHNIKSIVCGMTGATGAGWFKHEINTLKDLKKSKIAANGLVYDVYKDLGAAPIKVKHSELLFSIKTKKIDAVAFYDATADEYFELSKYTNYYYFPGWFQQARFIDLMINLEKWQKLGETQKKIIESACMANITDSLAVSESKQFDTLKELIKQGVDVRKFSPDITKALKKSWLFVAKSYSTSNTDFRQILNSIRKFSEDYSIWRELGKI
jgi:TRAP-type mannitol/chloroaromatic compound transport system substrate-binding protein